VDDWMDCRIVEYSHVARAVALWWSIAIIIAISVIKRGGSKRGTASSFNEQR